MYINDDKSLIKKEYLLHVKKEAINVPMAIKGSRNKT